MSSQAPRIRMFRSDDPSTRDPRQFGWGCFHHEDRSPAWRGRGVFGWFSKPADIIKYLVAEFSPALTGSDPRAQRICDELLKKTQDAEFSPQDLKQAATQFNATFKGVVQIRWCGQFSDLVASSEEYAEDLRRGFWMLAMEESTRPIPPDQLSAFCQYLQSLRAFHEPATHDVRTATG